MARKPDPLRLERIYKNVAKNPGKRPGYIACQLGLHRSEVTRMLPALEDCGLLLSEDENGGLWAYRGAKGGKRGGKNKNVA